MITLSLNTHVMRHPEIVSTEMGDETIIMSIEKGFYYGLNNVGSRILELTKQEISIGKLCRLIEAEYEIDPIDCEKAILFFVSQLAQQELVLVT